MNVWKLITRIGLIVCLLLLGGIGLKLFLPLMDRQKRMVAEVEIRKEDIRQATETLRLLRLKQEKLREDPQFIEKIAREDLGYAKPGETVFRFVEEPVP